MANDRSLGDSSSSGTRVPELTSGMDDFRMILLEMRDERRRPSFVGLVAGLESSCAPALSNAARAAEKAPASLNMDILLVSEFATPHSPDCRDSDPTEPVTLNTLAARFLPTSVASRE